MSFKIETPTAQLEQQIQQQGLNISNILHIYPGPLQRGGVRSNGFQVYFLQEKLNQLGFATPPLILDGQFGRLTEDAVIAYQKNKGFNPNGIVNFEIWYSLFPNVLI